MINVGGFLFEDEEIAQVARKEEEGIRFIRQRTDLDNPEVVIKLYKKLLETEFFVTPVGIHFLTELQNILLLSPYIGRDEIPPILVKKAEGVTKNEAAAPEVKPVETVKKVNKKSNSKDDKDYRKPFLAATFCAVILGISVVGMFVINAISGNNVNIINYRDQLLNEYSGWEAELREEEERLKDWESTLEQREEQLREQLNDGE